MGRPLISIVTPCFNEEANVQEHFRRVGAAIAPFSGQYDFEHIYTDNCSQDATFDLLSAMAKEQPRFRVLRFSRNIGADRAIYFGLQHAKGEAVILIQADLQDPPELIPEFIRGWQEGFDVVYGQIAERDEAFPMRLARRLYYRIVSGLSDIPIPRNAGEFRITSRRALDAVLQYRENDLYMRGVVAQVGFRQRPVPYVRAARAGGRTSGSLLYLLGYAVNGVVSTTVVPIRLVSIAGLLLAGLGFALTAWLIAAKLLYPTEAPHGFTTLASLITFFAGMQMLCIGVIGEYLRRTYIQTLQRPRGFVQDRIGFDDQR